MKKLKGKKAYSPWEPPTITSHNVWPCGPRFYEHD